MFGFSAIGLAVYQGLAWQNRHTAEESPTRRVIYAAESECPGAYALWEIPAQPVARERDDGRYLKHTGFATGKARKAADNEYYPSAPETVLVEYTASGSTISESVFNIDLTLDGDTDDEVGTFVWVLAPEVIDLRKVGDTDHFRNRKGVLLLASEGDHKYSNRSSAELAWDNLLTAIQHRKSYIMVNYGLGCWYPLQEPAGSRHAS